MLSSSTTNFAFTLLLSQQWTEMFLSFLIFSKSPLWDFIISIWPLVLLWGAFRSQFFRLCFDLGPVANMHSLLTGSVFLAMLAVWLYEWLCQLVGRFTTLIPTEISMENIHVCLRALNLVYSETNGGVWKWPCSSFSFHLSAYHLARCIENMAPLDEHSLSQLGPGAVGLLGWAPPWGPANPLN